MQTAMQSEKSRKMKKKDRWEQMIQKWREENLERNMRNIGEEENRKVKRKEENVKEEKRRTDQHWSSQDVSTGGGGGGGGEARKGEGWGDFWAFNFVYQNCIFAH